MRARATRTLLAFGVLIAVFSARPASATLAESFIGRIRVDAGLTEGQRARILASLERIAGTPTGAERARELIAGKWAVGISSASFGFTSEHGGKAGYCDLSADVPLVSLDSVVLASTETAYIDNTVAHEVLGHALTALKARKEGAGVARAWGAASDDEMLAELVGDVVAQELGASEDSNPLVDLLMESTQAYISQQWFGQTGFARSISVEESSAPAAALAARLTTLAQEEQRLQREIDTDLVWEREIIHLQTAHGAPESRYASRWTILEAAISRDRDDIALVDQSRESIRDRMFYLAMPAGIELRRQFDTPGFKRFGAAVQLEIEVLRRRLVATGVPPAAPGLVNKSPDEWDELRAAALSDQKSHPEHWR